MITITGRNSGRFRKIENCGGGTEKVRTWLRAGT